MLIEGHMDRTHGTWIIRARRVREPKRFTCGQTVKVCQRRVSRIAENLNNILPVHPDAKAEQCRPRRIGAPDPFDLPVYVWSKISDRNADTCIHPADDTGLKRALVLPAKQGRGRKGCTKIKYDLLPL